MRREARQEWQPRREYNVLCGRPPRSLAAARPGLMRDDASVQPPGQRPSAGRTPADRRITQQARYASPRGRRERLTSNGRGPGRHRPPGEGATHVGQDGHRRTLAASRVPSVGGRPEESLAVIRSLKMATTGAEEDVVVTWTPRRVCAAAFAPV